MTIDLSTISSWIWLILALVIVFVILRFFSHLVVGAIHFIMSFFWHGCAIAVAIFVVYLVLHAFHVL